MYRAASHTRLARMENSSIIALEPFMTFRQMHQIDRLLTARRTTSVFRILSAVAAVSVMSLPVSALSADTPSKAAHKPTAQQGQKKGSLKIKHQRSPSEESTAQRDKRLYRECKDMPNAGACLGYTRK